MPPPISDPPAHFCCPITQVLMEDPVLAPDGNSYDRAALLRWADERIPPRLPLTNLPFTVSQLVTNRSLRDAIDDWKVQVGLSVPPPNNNNTLAPPDTAMVPDDDLPPWVPQEVRRQTLKVSDLAVVGDAEVASGEDASSTLEVAVGGLPSDIHMQRPLHVVIVMDISGSMSAPASKRNSSGEEETFANCVLDLVKYAALAVSRMLNKNDFYSLVTYSDSAKLLLDHVPGDKWPLIASAIDKIKPGGATDLGSGFRQALDCVVRHANAANTNPPSLTSSAASSTPPPEASMIQNAVLLLTDGAPNTGLNGADMHRSFSRVHAATLSRTIINTYAFGYADDLASELMFEIATKGNGSFSYIPDVGFLGTVFIHAVANLRAVVSVVPESGIHSVSCGQVRCGIAKVEFDPRRTMPTDITQSCAASGFQVAKKIIGTIEGSVTIEGVKRALVGKDFGPAVTEAMLSKELLRSIHAQKVCDCILRCISGELGEPSESNFYALLGAANADLQAVQHIPYDIEQQVGPAFREAYFKRWGKHFLLSFVSAHIHQQCNNFKDKSVGGYKTAFIADKHDRYDDIFNMMEPPRPTDLSPPPAPTTTTRYQHQQSRTTITNTAQINNSRDPCVHEDSQVRMANGDLKAAKDVRPGDHVATFNGTPVAISHIIRTQCKGGSANLISFPPPSFAEGFYGGDHEGLRITPWHPVFLKEVSRSGSSRGPGTWKLPCDTGYPARAWKCDHVYSFCVQPIDDDSTTPAPPGFEPALMIDGVAVVYLAHGRSEPPLLKHAFFGTPQVLQQLPCDTHNIHTFAPEPVIKDDDGDDYAVLTLQQLGMVKGSGLACAWDMRKLVPAITATPSTATKIE